MPIACSKFTEQSTGVIFVHQRTLSDHQGRHLGYSMSSSSYIVKISVLRKLRPFTQQDMADRLGYRDVREYGRVEQGEKRLTIDLMENIAQAFGMDLISLLNFDEGKVLNGQNPEVPETGIETELVLTLRARIRHMEGEVEFLRKQLEKP